MTTALVLAFNRPELLQLCLERVRDAQHPPGLQVQVVIDRYRSSRQRECRLVASAFHHDALAFGVHSYIGNSCVVLESLRAAFRDGAERLYLIEEDVLIAPDFFLWHDRVLQETGAFASVAWRNIRSAAPAGGAQDFYLSECDYSSVGVAWPRRSMPAILEHATPHYYRDMPGYILRRFAGSRFGTEFPEQDGLIIRVMGESGQPCAWSLPPRAWHIGWYGYHRPLREAAGRPTGSLQRRIDSARRAVAAGSFAGGDVDGGPSTARGTP